MALSNFIYKPSQPYLFNRAWSVTVGPPGQAAASEYTQLRTVFDIDRLGAGTAAKAKIDVYNLSLQSRQTIQKGWNVMLKAGYRNQQPIPTMFIGVVGINGAHSKRDGADIITTFECDDGGPALIQGTWDHSYPGGSTTLAQVIDDLITASGLGKGVVAIPSVTFNKGFTAHGSITDTMNKLTQKLGLSWFVTNGNIDVIPIKGFNGQTAEVVSASNGMIGVPSVDNQVLKFDNLLNPKLVPGGLVQMISENSALNGFYKINRSHLVGDSHDSKWQMSVEAVLFPNVGFNLSQFNITGSFGGTA